MPGLVEMNKCCDLTSLRTSLRMIIFYSARKYCQRKYPLSIIGIRKGVLWSRAYLEYILQGQIQPS